MTNSHDDHNHGPHGHTHHDPHGRDSHEHDAHEGDAEFGLDDFNLLAGEGEEEIEGVTSLSDEDLEVLREAVALTLTGGNAGLLEELVGDAELDEDFAEDAAEFAAEEVDPHDLALQQAAVEAAAEARARAIYQEFLNRAPEHKFDPKLDRVVQVLDILGDPQNAYPSLQVVGTNGKTSVTRMSAALLAEMGLRTGSFTSPHLVDVRERIAINGKPLSAAQFVAAWEDIAPYVDMVDQAAKQAGGPTLSYFELLTVLAIATFADAPVDVAVFEAGMGGRWDATNVVNSGVQVITPISIDHQQWLGEDLASIASEKAEVIKEKSIVVVMKQEPEALAVIEKVAAETDSIIWLEGRDWRVLGRQAGVGGQMVDIQTPGGTYESVFVPVHGKHQSNNAAAALVAVEAMLGGKPLAGDVVDAGFEVVRTPGRMEVVRTSPTIVVDGAHNPAGVAAMREALDEAFKFNFTVGVFGAMEDKNIEAMLVEIEPELDSIVVVELPGERAADEESLLEIANDVFGEDRVYSETDVASALDKAVELVDRPTDQTLTRGIIVFGSLFLVGDTIALLQR